MKRAILFSALLLFAVTGFAGPKVKQLICHVGSNVGPGGEVYLDDPDCVPDDTNNYFCPDAGKIDLIRVPANSNHLGNDAHSFDGFYDYDPIATGASGEGTEDSNGNGIDDGCEPVEPCPCWDEVELQNVTALNQQNSSSCSNGSNYPTEVIIQNVEGSTPGLQGGFIAFNQGTNQFCATRDPDTQIQQITSDEANACIEQIATRCDDIGDRIVIPPGALSCPCWKDITEAELAAHLNAEEWTTPNCGYGGGSARAVDDFDVVPFVLVGSDVCFFQTSVFNASGTLSVSEAETCFSEIVPVIEQIDACQ